MSNKKQSNLVQGLKDYFNNTPQEQLAKEFAGLEMWNRIGPDVLDYFKNIQQQKVISKMREEVPVLESSRQSWIEVAVEMRVSKLYNTPEEFD